MSQTDEQKTHTLAVLYDVRDERERQDTKWGEQNHNPFIWLAILGEEVGETNNAVLEAHDWKNKIPGNFDAEKLKHYREEAIQVAAVAVAMVESLDRRLEKEKGQ